ncbi:hypothetical protein LIER_07400 [Lithospermum erythrorhizon]|uniref:GAG-pre-integrase domain-containing protein n=1 Tax=Lithospermum erythrorhizon TaxID=34254 RepID=A0AAV3P8E9_LITER
MSNEKLDLTTMNLDELIGNLATFEMSLDEGEPSKKKEIALKASSEAECPNYLKKQSKNYSSILSDDESEDGQDDQISNLVAFTGVLGPTVTVNSEDEEDMTDEEVLENYKLLYTKWMELTLVYTKVVAERKKLKIEDEKLRKLGVDQDQEIHHLKAQVNPLNKGLKMMNSSTNIVEEIFGVGKDVGDSTGIDMHEVRSADNCYLWSSVKALTSKKGEDAELWHKKLGHTNYRNIQQIMSKDVVRGIPPLDVKNKACGEC